LVNIIPQQYRLATKAPTGQAAVTVGYDLHNRLLSESTPVVAGNPATGNFQFAANTLCPSDHLRNGGINVKLIS
jgi:hypothetical protein